MAACTPHPEPGGGSPDVIVVNGDPIPTVSRPLAGGRVAVTGDGPIVASDEDGDLVVAHWPDGTERVLLLPIGWAPGAVAAEGDLAAVVAQGAGAVALVRVALPDVFHVERIEPVCPDPRGVSVAGGTAWVACGDGQLTGVDVEGIVGSWFVEPDLTHVFVADGEAFVATARDGEVLRVDLASGVVTQRYALPTLPSPDGHTLVARVVRRITDAEDGRVLVLHQAHVTDPLSVELDGPPAYGTGACLSVARPLLTWIAPEDDTTETVRIDAVLPLDVVAWPEGDGAFPVPTPVVAAVDVGSGGPGLQSVYPAVAMSDPAVFCVPRTVLASTPGPTVGVDLGADGQLVAVSRDPFSIVVGQDVVTLGEEVRDLGARLFHAPSPSGVTCASCHALGRDDGHTWDFVGFGPRRTQSLVGGLGGTAPYHWDGSLADLGVLFEETGVGRMGHAPATAADIAALGVWLDGLAVPPRLPADSEDAAAGEAVFEGAGCAVCHAGPTYTDNSTQDVGTGGPFQVPSLVGVSFRLPWMHDGCAVTPEDRFDPDCGGAGHGSTADLDPDEITDLITFLGSL